MPRGFDWTERYAPVIASARALRYRCSSAVIDGEMCVQDANGITNYHAFKKAMVSQPERLVLFAFDLLMLDGRDLRGDPLIGRRRRLQDLISGSLCSRVGFSEHHVGDGPALFRSAERHGLEGIVSKRADSRYLAGRTKAWIKVKSFAMGEFQVVGVERSKEGMPVSVAADSIASRLPRIMTIPIVGTLIRADLFCAIWISCIPIGLALGGAVLDHVLRPYSPATIQATSVLNVSGLLAGPVFASIVMLTLRTRQRAEACRLLQSDTELT